MIMSEDVSKEIPHMPARMMGLDFNRIGLFSPYKHTNQARKP